MQIKKRWIVVVILGIFLTGCGGGSGGKNSSFDASNNSPIIEDVVTLDTNSTTQREDNISLYSIEQNATDIVAYVKENTRDAFKVVGKDQSTIFYSLSDEDFHSCYIDPKKGELFFNNPTDYEKKSVYKFNVILSDIVGNQTIKRVTIYVRDEKNENIIISTDVNNSLPVDSEQKYFITTWKVDTSNGKQLTIPTLGDGYLYSIDWGDGLSTKNVTTQIRHIYKVEGIYTIKIAGDFPRIKINKVYAEFNSRRNEMEIKTDFSELNSKLLSVEQWGNIKWESMRFAFANTNVKIKAIDNPDLSNVTDMTGMFLDLCGKIDAYERAPCGDVNLNSWDVSTVTNMSMLFRNADFEPNISKWNVSNVTNMSNMFGGLGDRYDTLAVNVDISKWDVSKVIDMSKMFDGNTYFNKDIGNWNVSNVTNMSEMFQASSPYQPTTFNQDIGNWDVSKVKDMHDMFNICEFNQDIGNWNVSNVTNMSYMFAGEAWSRSSFNQDIGRWNVSKVKDMSYMFNTNDYFNRNLERWNVTNDVNTSKMFENTSALEVLPTWYKE